MTKERENGFNVLRFIADNTGLSLSEAIEKAYDLGRQDELKQNNADTLDKIKSYLDHIRNTGMGKEKGLEFIDKFIEGLRAESEEV